MNLKPRFLLLSTILILLSGAGIWLFSQQIALNVLQSWALRHFETQVRLEKERSLQPVIREVALARQFADSSILLDWARDPQDEKKKRQALAEMESFRHNFAEHSYFVALLASGDYYYNNADNEFAGQEYRYSLRPENPDDRWFYSIIEQNRTIHLNVNPDIPLKVTKLWIDVLLRDGDQILGVVGTGLDLTTYIKAVTTAPEPGIENLFFDHEGAIQISRDVSQIDFASITKNDSEQKTVWQLISEKSQRDELRALMATAQQNAGEVSSLYITHNGEPALAGVMYLPEVDWYVMTLLDLDELLPLSTFNSIFILAAASVLISLLLFNLALNRHILQPVTKLERAITRVRSGDTTVPDLPHNMPGEVGRLLDHFAAMAGDVVHSREVLEAKVRQRTEELEHQTLTDPLTGLLNRRGMLQQLTLEMNRLQREDSLFGIIWLDLDHFKDINDHYGHGAGDRALEATADHIRSHLRAYDFASRWGGDEFLILVKTPDPHLLDQLGQRICQVVDEMKLPQGGEYIHVTISAGSCIAEPGNSLNDILTCADKALYRAKAAGRNNYRSGIQHAD